MNKKLCIVTPTLGCGGFERVVSELANYANSNGYIVTIICLFNAKVHYQLNQSVNLITPNFSYKKGIYNKIQTFLYLIKNLFKIKPDSVLGFSEVFNPLTVLTSRLTLNQVYISDRSSPNKRFNSRVNLIRKLIYPFAHGLIAQTEQAKQYLVQNRLNNNIIVIPNPLRVINDCYIKKTGKIIVTMGKLVPSKNFLNLIEIFASLENADDWKLFILGDGPQRELLLNRIKGLNLINRVFLEGAVKDVDKYFSNASIFAFTSLSEGFPNALSEAMAYPLACISYDCIAGPSDIIANNENGVLVPLGDSETFKRQLQNLITDPLLMNFYREKAFLNRKLFSGPNICDRFLHFILSNNQ